jgi:hypothetical protein
MRHPTHCQEAENVTFSVVDGFSKRAGTKFMGKIADGNRTIEYRMHKFERDEDLEFAVVYGPGVFTILNLNTGETTDPTISSAAASYISHGSPSADQLKLITIADATFVLNRLAYPACHGTANEKINEDTMPMLLVRNLDGTWDMDTRVWNERPKIQQVLKHGASNATGGTFKIQYKGTNSSAIKYNATNAEIDDAIEEMNTIGAGKVQCFGGPINREDVIINLSPDLPDLEDMVVVGSSVQGTTFTIERGSDDINPAPRIIKDGLGITDISYYRNRLILAGDEYVVFSQADDLFNFYYTDGSIIIDSDPIEVALAASDVTIVDHVQPHGDTVIIMTTAGQQFQLQGGDVLAPSTVSITPSTRYETQSMRPVTMGDSIYFPGDHKGYSIMYEYTYNQDLISYRAVDITKHCFDLIPPNMVTIRASLNNDTLVVVPRNDINEASTEFTSKTTGNWSNNDGTVWDGGSGGYRSPQEWDTAIIEDGDEITFDDYADVSGQVKTTVGASNIYVYRRYQKGNELVQSAWSKWSFGTNDTADNIMDCLIVDNDLFFLTRDDAQGADEDVTALLLWKVTLTEERTAETNFAYDVMLDHKHTISAYTEKTGSGPYTYTYVLPIWDPGVDTVVLSNEWVGNSGTVITANVTTNRDASGNRIVAFETALEPNGEDEATVMLGRSYDANVEFSTVFMRTNDHLPVSEGKVILQKILVDHYKAGPYKIVINDTSATNRDDREFAFTPDTGHSEEFGTTTAWIHARPRDTTISVKISEPKPCTISAIEYHGHYGSLLGGKG